MRCELPLEFYGADSGVTTPASPVSHLDDPMGPNAWGESRRWGDISHDRQRAVIERVLNEAAHQGLTKEEAALALAIARVESGFNPDAAAALSSASGLGQFIDRTGVAYGIDDDNRFDLDIGSRALVAHLADNLARARRHEQEARAVFELAYAYHHDGPSLAYGGRELARERVLPWYDRFAEWLVRCG